MHLDKNFGLTKEKFAVLLQELKEGNETLFEEIFLSNFQKTCFFIKKKCKISYDEAYDITMNTLLDYRLRLLDGKIVYGNLKSLFRQMAYHNFVKTVRESEKKEKVLKLNYREAPVLENEERDLFNMLENAFKKLELKCKNLLDKFYYLGISYEDLAREEKISYQAIRKRKERCISKLKADLKKQFEACDIRYEQFRRIFE